MNENLWIGITAALRGVAIAVVIVFVVLLFGAGCHTKPPVLPAGTVICKTPYIGTDCLDSYGEFSTFKNGLACNTCLTSTDLSASPNGCAWASSPGAPNLWCTSDCRTCSAVVPTFAKKD